MEANYREVNDMLQAQNELYKDAHSRMKNDINDLILENERLRNEIKQYLDEQKNSELLSSSANNEDNQSVVVENLKKQLEQSIQENEDIMKLWHMATSEIERLEKTGRQETASLGDPNLNLQVQQHFHEKLERIKNVESELNSSRVQLRKKELELIACNKDIETSRMQVKEVLKKIELLEQKNADILKERKEEHMDLTKISDELRLIKMKNANLADDYAKSKDQAQSMVSQVTHLNNKLKEVESLEAIAVGKLREYSQVAENALLEKDSALAREKLALGNVRRMEQLINQLMHDAGLKAKSEVDKLKKRYNDNIEDMIEQMHLLETELSSSKLQVEKLSQENNLLTASLNQIGNTNQVENTSDVDEKLLAAIHDRDLVSLEADRLRNIIKVTNKRYEKEAMVVKSNFEQVHNHLKAKMEELQKMSNERLQLSKQVEETQHSLRKSKEATQATILNYEKQISDLKEENKLLQDKNRIKLRSCHESQINLKNNMQNQIRQQQQLIIKLKEQLSLSQQKEDLKNTSLKTDAEKITARNQTLIAELNSLKMKLVQKEEKLRHYEDEFIKMDKRLKVTENLMETCKSLPIDSRLNPILEISSPKQNSSIKTVNR